MMQTPVECCSNVSWKAAEKLLEIKFIGFIGTLQ